MKGNQKMARKKVKGVQRQLARIGKQIKRMESRGYRLPGELSSANYRKTLAGLSWQKLRGAFSSEKLYEKATALSESGKIVSGKERRTEESKEAARKAAETRKLPKEVDLVLDRIKEKISNIPTKGSYFLEKELNREIKLYGETAVAEAIQNVPDEFLSEVDTLLKYEDADSESYSATIKKFAEIVRGSMLDRDEMALIEEYGY